MANAITLTFAGDTTSVQRSFGEVTAGAKRMGDSVKESASGFSRAGEAADEVDTKAMGFRDTLTGVQDSMSGLAMLSKGPSFEGFLTLGAGIGDLGSGMYNFLIPALEKTKLATIAQTAVSKAAEIGSKAWAAAQWVMNSALFASPITWIVVGIVALIAIIVLIATKTDWFQKAWSAAWGWIKGAASSTWDFIKQIPGWIGTAFGKISDFVSAPFKAAFNAVSKAWNATVGKLSWTVPGWVPFIGGNSISVPKLPTFHSGGVVPGTPGTAVPILALAGERIGAMSSAVGAGTVTVRAGDGLIGALLEQLAAEVRARGGDPAAIGIRAA